MKNAFSIITICLLFSCCSKKYTSSELPEDKLVFGSGGGFSGFYTEYVLLKNGQLFETKDPKKVMVELKSIPKKQAKKIFNRCDSLSIGTMEFKHPDNFSYYIEVATKENSNRITWGQVDNPIAPEIDKFFKELKRLSIDNVNIQ